MTRALQIIATVALVVCAVALSSLALDSRSPDQGMAKAVKAATAELRRLGCVQHALAVGRVNPGTLADEVDGNTDVPTTGQAVGECEKGNGWGDSGFEP